MVLQLFNNKINKIYVTPVSNSSTSVSTRTLLQLLNLIVILKLEVNFRIFIGNIQENDVYHTIRTRKHANLNYKEIKMFAVPHT